MIVKEGDLAPGFSKDSNYECVQMLFPYVVDKNIVLYFYPKDDTPGCTKEAESFRDIHSVLAGLDTVIVGVSKDSSSSHENFKKKYGLQFELVTDSEAALAQAYGVWVEKSMFGKSYMGIERSTFLIDKCGTVRKVWRNVKVHGHADEVLQFVRDL